MRPEAQPGLGKEGRVEPKVFFPKLSNLGPELKKPMRLKRIQKGPGGKSPVTG